MYMYLGGSSPEPCILRGSVKVIGVTPVEVRNLKGEGGRKGKTMRERDGEGGEKERRKEGRMTELGKQTFLLLSLPVSQGPQGTVTVTMTHQLPCWQSHTPSHHHGYGAPSTEMHVQARPIIEYCVRTCT